MFSRGECERVIYSELDPAYMPGTLPLLAYLIFTNTLEVIITPILKITKMRVKEVS